MTTAVAAPPQTATPWEFYFRDELDPPWVERHCIRVSESDAREWLAQQYGSGEVDEDGWPWGEESLRHAAEQVAHLTHLGRW